MLPIHHETLKYDIMGRNLPMFRQNGNKGAPNAFNIASALRTSRADHPLSLL
jgi:hypothetical protein